MTRNKNNIMDMIASAKPVGGARHPFIGEGRHLVTVESFNTFDSRENGESFNVVCVVNESDAHKVGDRVTAVWMPFRHEKWPNGTTDADRLADFLNAIGLENPQEDIGYLRTAEGQAAQPLRGIQAVVTGWKSRGKDGQVSDYVKIKWEAVDQSDADIASARKTVEASLTAEEPEPPPATMSSRLARLTR